MADIFLPVMRNGKSKEKVRIMISELLDNLEDNRIFCESMK